MAHSRYTVSDIEEDYMPLGYEDLDREESLETISRSLASLLDKYANAPLGSLYVTAASAAPIIDHEAARLVNITTPHHEVRDISHSTCYPIQFPYLPRRVKTLLSRNPTEKPIRPFYTRARSTLASPQSRNRADTNIRGQYNPLRELPGQSVMPPPTPPDDIPPRTNTVARLRDRFENQSSRRSASGNDGEVQEENGELPLRS